MDGEGAPVRMEIDERQMRECADRIVHAAGNRQKLGKRGRIALGRLSKQLLGNVIRSEEGGERDDRAGAARLAFRFREGLLERREHGARVLGIGRRFVHAPGQAREVARCPDVGAGPEQRCRVRQRERQSAERLGDVGGVVLAQIGAPALLPQIGDRVRQLPFLDLDRLHRAWPAAQSARDQDVAVARGRPFPQHARIVDVVVNQQPRLLEAAMGDQLQRLARGPAAILDLVEAADEDGAEVDERPLDALEARGAVVGLRGIEPPDAGVVAPVPMRVLAREDRLADAAEPVRGDRLRHGRGVARP